MSEVEIVKLVVQALDAIGVPYMLVGSFSSNAYGIPRSTKDCDVVVQLGNTSLSKVLPLLPGGFRLEPQIGFETVTSTIRYRMHYDPMSFMIEFFEVSDDPHDRLRFENRREVNYGGFKTFLPRAEDVVITKLRWSRSGKRTKDVDDVRDVLAVQRGKLDLRYIREWCTRYSMLDIFEKTLKSVPQP